MLFLCCGNCCSENYEDSARSSIDSNEDHCFVGAGICFFEALPNPSLHPAPQDSATAPAWHVSCKCRSNLSWWSHVHINMCIYVHCRQYVCTDAYTAYLFLAELNMPAYTYIYIYTHTNVSLCMYIRYIYTYIICAHMAYVTLHGPKRMSQGHPSSCWLHCRWGPRVETAHRVLATGTWRNTCVHIHMHVYMQSLISLPMPVLEG